MVAVELARAKTKVDMAKKNEEAEAKVAEEAARAKADEKAHSDATRQKRSIRGSTPK